MRGKNALPFSSGGISGIIRDFTPHDHSQRSQRWPWASLHDTSGDLPRVRRKSWSIQQILQRKNNTDLPTAVVTSEGIYVRPASYECRPRYHEQPTPSLRQSLSARRKRPAPRWPSCSAHHGCFPRTPTTVSLTLLCLFVLCFACGQNTTEGSCGLLIWLLHDKGIDCDGVSLHLSARSWILKPHAHPPSASNPFRIQPFLVSY